MRRSSQGAAAALAALLALAGAPGCGDEPVQPFVHDDTRRQIEQGELVGMATEDGAHAWLGLPFAEPPVEHLRWRAPRLPSPWAGTLEALQRGPACVQYAGLLAPDGERGESGEPTGSEDCLVLDVYAPPFAPDAVPRGDERRPVMVWIHGGGNTIGSGHFYDGSLLATREDVVVVVVQYRLGAFGWFSHPALQAPLAAASDYAADDASGNFGTLDLVRALEWVRDNVAAFGGDPSRVTIFGESAGGTNVFSLLVSPRASGLFHRAIVQSGSTSSSSRAEAQNLVDAEEPGRPSSSAEIVLKALQADGRADDRESALATAASLQPEDVDALLRRRDAYELLRLWPGDRLGGMYRNPSVIRDGHVLPPQPFLERLRAGAYNRVPVMAGTNRDENKLFMLGDSPDVARLFGVPLWLKDEVRYDAVAELMALMWKVRGADDPAAAIRAADGPDVYVYRFDWDEQGSLLAADFSKLLGAAHGLEIPFVFGRLDFPLFGRVLFPEASRPGAETLSAAMMAYWGAFARDGSPGTGSSGELPQWTAWNPASGAEKFMLLDSPDGGGLRMSPEAVDVASVIARTESDDRLPRPEDRCGVLYTFVRWNEVMTEEQYESAADGLCRDYPLDDFPWRG